MGCGEGAGVAMATMPAWYDPVETVGDVLRTLRLDPADPDVTGAIVPCADAAAVLIDDYLDREAEPLPPAPPPPPIRRAVMMVAIELYRRKDAPFGVLNSWSIDDIPLRIGTDWIKGVENLLLPYKLAWGLA